MVVTPITSQEEDRPVSSIVDRKQPSASKGRERELSLHLATSVSYGWLSSQMYAPVLVSFALSQDTPGPFRRFPTLAATPRPHMAGSGARWPISGKEAVMTRAPRDGIRARRRLRFNWKEALGPIARML